MDSAKVKIGALITAYMRDSQGEYELLLAALSQHRNRIEDKMDFTTKSDMMPMYELTETLQMKLSLGLEADELAWLKTKEGGRWFIGAYPQFSLQ